MIRSTKARAMAKAGLIYVAGWVRAKDAPAVQYAIDAAKPDADAVAARCGDE